MIKELNELVWFAKKSVWRDEALLSFLSGNKPEVLQIYQGLAREKYRTDEEAALGIGVSTTTFKKYGKALLHHLYEMVYFFNDEKANIDVTAKNIFLGAKELAQVRMLAWRGCRLSSKSAAQRLLRRGTAYEWPEFVVSASLFLKEAVVRLGGTHIEFDAYDALYQQHMEYLILERKAWDYYQRTKMPSRKAGMSGKAQSQTIEAFLAELQPHVGRISSYFFHLYYFIIRNYYHYQKGDYQGLIDNCEEAIRYFRAKSYPVVNPLSIFYYTKVVGHTILEEFEQGEQDVLASLEILEDGSANWFSAMEIYIFLAIHTEHYQKAYELYMQAVGHRRLDTLHSSRQDTWRIIGAYCFILQQLTGSLPPDGFPVFKSRKFLNDILTFSTDKNGMNIALLIAHTLLQLLEDREEEMIDRIQSLIKYSNRHLRHDSTTKRSMLFIRILSVLSRTHCNKTFFLQHARPLLEEMARHPRQLSNQTHELEIIPYERLTMLIAERLDFKAHS